MDIWCGIKDQDNASGKSIWYLPLSMICKIGENAKFYVIYRTAVELQEQGASAQPHFTRFSSSQQFLELHAPCPEPKAGPPGGSIFRRTQ